MTGPQACASPGHSTSTTSATRPSSNIARRAYNGATAAAQGGVARAAARAMRAHVEHQRRLGVLGYPRGPRRRDARAPPAAPRERAAPRGPRRASTAAAGVAVRRARPSRAPARSTALRAAIGDCQRCKLAGAPHQPRLRRRQPAGAADVRRRGARAPTRTPQGEPFVGRAGQLLTEIITKGMKLRREDVYIANVVKCRPPGQPQPGARRDRERASRSSPARSS